MQLSKLVFWATAWYVSDTMSKDWVVFFHSFKKKKNQQNQYSSPLLTWYSGKYCGLLSAVKVFTNGNKNFSLDLKQELFAFLFPSAWIPVVLIIFISIYVSKGKVSKTRIFCFALFLRYMTVFTRSEQNSCWFQIYFDVKCFLSAMNNSFKIH